MKAMILAAGLGTRLKPWTDHHPKALALVNGKSLLQRNIEYLQQHNIFDIVINVHHFADQIIQAVETNKGWGSTVAISNESEGVLETGGGLVNARPLLAGTDNFVLLNADILTSLNLSAMIKKHQQQNALATLATSIRPSSRFLLFDHLQNLKGWRNTKTGEEKVAAGIDRQLLTAKAFSGIHIIQSQIFTHITHQGKFSMIDIYLHIMKDYSIKSFDHPSNKFIDVGKPESIPIAEQMFQ